MLRFFRRLPTGVVSRSQIIRNRIQPHAVAGSRFRIKRCFATEKVEPKEDDKKPKKEDGVDDATAKRLADAARTQQKMFDTFIPDGNMSITHPAVAVMICAIVIIQVFYLGQFGKAPVNEEKLREERMKEREKLREKEKVHLQVGAAPNEGNLFIFARHLLGHNQHSCVRQAEMKR